MGVVPNTELATAAGLEVDNGLADESLDLKTLLPAAQAAAGALGQVNDCRDDCREKSRVNTVDSPRNHA